MGEGRGEGAFGRSRIENLGDVRVVHDRQGLALGFEAGHDFPRIHADLDYFESDAAFDRLFLLGHIDDAEAAFAEFLQQLVITDDAARAFAQGADYNCLTACCAQLEGVASQKLIRLQAGLEQIFDALAQVRVSGASGIEVSGARLRVRHLPGYVEEGFFASVRRLHGKGN